jgi:hypothetical protein
MHCLACDVLLSDQEAVRKDKRGTFLDLCNNCTSDPEDQEVMQEYNYLSTIEVVDE